jgi:hypothetical protein
MAGDWIAESLMDDPGYIYLGSRPDRPASHDLSYENGQIRQNGHPGQNDQNDQNSPNHVTDQAYIIQFSQAQRQHP